MEHDNFTLSDDINGPLLAAVIGIEMLVGLIANSLVLILTLCYLRTWKQPSNIFLINMLLINLATALFVMPFSFITCATGEWIFGSTWSQKVAACNFTAYINFYCFVAVIESLTLLSFDRFFFIVKALQYKKYMTGRKAIMIVAASWILAAIMVSPPLYGFGKFEFAYSYGTCIPGFKKEVGFSMYTFIVGLSFIMSVIVTSTWTYCYTRKYFKKRNDRRNIIGNSLYLSQERKLIGLFGMLIIIHLLCYSLILTAAAVESFSPLPPILYAASFSMLMLITVLSPMAQAYFRYDIRNLVYTFLIAVRPKTTVSRKEATETDDTSRI